jgi:hypothetical protein
VWVEVGTLLTTWDAYLGRRIAGEPAPGFLFARAIATSDQPDSAGSTEASDGHLARIGRIDRGHSVERRSSA